MKKYNRKKENNSTAIYLVMNISTWKIFLENFFRFIDFFFNFLIVFLSQILENLQLR